MPFPKPKNEIETKSFIINPNTVWRCFQLMGGGGKVEVDAVLCPFQSMAGSYLPTGKLNIKNQKKKR